MGATGAGWGIGEQRQKLNSALGTSQYDSFHSENFKGEAEIIHPNISPESSVRRGSPEQRLGGGGGRGGREKAGVGRWRDFIFFASKSDDWNAPVSLAAERDTYCTTINCLPFMIPIHRLNISSKRKGLK